MYGNDINAITIDKILYILDGMCRGNFVLNRGQMLIQCLPTERSRTRGFRAIVDISLVLRACLVVFECVMVKEWLKFMESYLLAIGFKYLEKLQSISLAFLQNCLSIRIEQHLH